MIEGACLSRSTLLLAPGFDSQLLGRGEQRGQQRVEQALAIEGGVAIIPIFGVLETHQGWLRGYDAIGAEIGAALAASDIAEIVLWCNSPGGNAEGCFDLADAIFAARGSKPITALIDDNALSAAFVIASAADRVLITRSGGAGSVGVRGLHLDLSGALEQAGIRATEIYAGARKVDGSPFAPLSDGARARWQGEIDRVFALLIETIARNRALSVKQVREQEAAILYGPEAVAAGLADQVIAFTNVHRRQGAGQIPQRR